MYTYPVGEAKNSFSMLLDMAALGHEIRITKHGQEIAKIVSATSKVLKTANSKLMEQASEPNVQTTKDQTILNELTAIRSRVKPATRALSWQDARDDGRRA
jgi:prevent-host-death family protein